MLNDGAVQWRALVFFNDFTPSVRLRLMLEIISFVFSDLENPTEYIKNIQKFSAFDNPFFKKIEIPIFWHFSGLSNLSRTLFFLLRGRAEGAHYKICNNNKKIKGIDTSSQNYFRAEFSCLCGNVLLFFKGSHGSGQLLEQPRRGLREFERVWQRASVQRNGSRHVQAARCWSA